eukprot:gnl/TRDRNA2_/TRDRNA2_109398_c0_seq1.p1 gnl/TRDRNA2_/TRDRNA2_109398_c0~~gnl/TRDRNA2_/TRDRNA2_109398_c0_seq1.p1  ORF type:complete len:275 (+),score=42.39 gnl/TRDRNA2_/TRDRNA2_109398_c0_seq1:63-887(+)
MMSTSQFGLVDSKQGIYYTLMQPNISSGIGLARFDVAARAKTWVPLAYTVVIGSFIDGHIVGMDEDGKGPYFVSIDPSTGKNATPKLPLGKYTTMACGTADDSGTFWAVLNEGGASFQLVAIDISTARLKHAPVKLQPTPDRQGPVGLTFVGDSSPLLALMPVSKGGPWALVSIDQKTGAVRPTHSLDGLMPMRAYGSGDTFLEHGSHGPVLRAVLAESLGAPGHMLAIDVACALADGMANCTLADQPWPPQNSVAPVSLAMYEPEHVRVQVLV